MVRPHIGSKGCACGKHDRSPKLAAASLSVLHAVRAQQKTRSSAGAAHLLVSPEQGGARRGRAGKSLGASHGPLPYSGTSQAAAAGQGGPPLLTHTHQPNRPYQNRNILLLFPPSRAPTGFSGSWAANTAHTACAVLPRCRAVRLLTQACCLLKALEALLPLPLLAVAILAITVLLAVPGLPAIAGLQLGRFRARIVSQGRMSRGRLDKGRRGTGVERRQAADFGCRHTVPQEAVPLTNPQAGTGWVLQVATTGLLPHLSCRSAYLTGPLPARPSPNPTLPAPYAGPENNPPQTHALWHANHRQQEQQAGVHPTQTSQTVDTKGKRRVSKGVEMGQKQCPEKAHTHLLAVGLPIACCGLSPLRGLRPIQPLLLSLGAAIPCRGQHVGTQGSRPISRSLAMHCSL